MAPPQPSPRPATGEIRRLVAVARPWLTGAVVTGLGQAVLLTAQAAVLAGLLATAMRHQLTVRLAARDALLIAGLALGQGLLGWAWDTLTEAAVRRARAVTRHRALAGAIRLAAAGPRGRKSSGRVAWPRCSAPGWMNSSRWSARCCRGPCWPWPCRPCCWPGSRTWT